MLVDIVSDLHFEFDNPDAVDYEDSIRQDPNSSHRGDVLVVAGDIYASPVIENRQQIVGEFFETARKFYDKGRILYVLGNHDCWYDSLVTAPRNYEKYIGIKPLNNSSRFIDGVTFFGGTGWSEIDNPVEQVIAEMKISDYRHIKNCHVETTNLEAKKFHKALLNAVETARGRLIAVSHHPPIDVLKTGIVGDRGSSSNESLFKYQAVDGWIFGHIHEASPTEYYSIPLMCNPRGYYRHNEPFAVRQFEI